MKRRVHFDDYWFGHYRVLAEVCAATVHWIRYGIDDECSCAEVLFRHSDAQLKRIAELAKSRLSLSCSPEVRRLMN